MHGSVEDTKLSTNKQLSLSLCLCVFVCVCVCDGFCNQNAYVGVVECAPASLPTASSSLTHARRMDGLGNCVVGIPPGAATAGGRPGRRHRCECKGWN
jgi:hypothetical protein